MIKIVLADYREQLLPVVAQAVLPGKIGSTECDVTFELVLKDEWPIITAKAAARKHGWKQDFFFAVRAPEFRRWQDYARQLPQGRHASHVLPAASASMHDLEVTAWYTNHPPELRLYTQMSRYLTVAGGDLAVWAHDLEWLLTLGSQIYTYVMQMKAQRREDLLGYVEMLLVKRQL